MRDFSNDRWLSDDLGYKEALKAIEDYLVYLDGQSKLMDAVLMQPSATIIAQIDAIGGIRGWAA